MSGPEFPRGYGGYPDLELPRPKPESKGPTVLTTIIMGLALLPLAIMLLLAHWHMRRRRGHQLVEAGTNGQPRKKTRRKKWRYHRENEDTETRIPRFLRRHAWWIFLLIVIAYAWAWVAMKPGNRFFPF
jgi:hypothetical protein